MKINVKAFRNLIKLLEMQQKKDLSIQEIMNELNCCKATAYNYFAAIQKILKLKNFFKK